MVALLAFIVAIAATEILMTVGFVLWVLAVIVTDAVAALVSGLGGDGE